MSDNLLEKLYDKQDKMSEDLTEVKVILAKQEENIRIHIHRTNLLEENTEMLRASMKPLEAHVNMVGGALKFLGVLGIFASITKAIIEVIRF